MKTDFTTCHPAVKKVVDVDSICIQRRGGNTFTLKIVFLSQVARNVLGREFPLSRNFDVFLDRMVSYFSFCSHFPGSPVSILSDEITDFFCCFDGGDLLPASTGMNVGIGLPVCKTPYLSSDTASTHVDVSICTLK